MTQLRELTKTGRQEVKKAIQQGDPVTEVSNSTLHEHSHEIEGATADLDTLQRKLDDIVKKYDDNDHNIDKAAARHVHECIDISRRTAARVGLWHWLAVSEFPEFVYHRWPDADDEEKFLDGGTDIYSNAIHQLWWGAELTREGDDYTTTEQMFGQGRLANDVLDSWSSRYAPSAKIHTKTLLGESSDVVRETSRDIRNNLSVYTLELMSDVEIQNFMEETLRENRS
jgi:hypothetical protein